MWSLRRYNFFSFPHTILGRPEMLIHTVFEEAHDGISTHAFRGLSICEVNHMPEGKCLPALLSVQEGILRPGFLLLLSK